MSGLALCLCWRTANTTRYACSDTIDMANTFLYFAYGSNLLAKRIHINNPTAIRRDIGKLKNYRLDFATYSKRWHGASATIVPTRNEYVWGAIWEIHISNMADLDRQEGVQDKLYCAKTVDIETPDGSLLKCKVYEQWNNPTDHLTGQLLPQDRRPSAAYRSTILAGARESGLPADYIQFLQTIPHNGYVGEPDIGLHLRLSENSLVPINSLPTDFPFSPTPKSSRQCWPGPPAEPQHTKRNGCSVFSLDNLKSQ